MSATAALAELARDARVRPPAPPRPGGRVLAFDGLTIHAGGLDLGIGAVCGVGPLSSPAEVIGFRDGRTMLMGLSRTAVPLPGAGVVPLADAGRVSVGDALLGRVLDGGGQPIDGGPVPRTDARVALDPGPGNPLLRGGVDTVLDCGIRAINALLTLGRGQRVGIMAGSGVGKSVLLGQIARFAAADVVVVALIGERGREIGDFVTTQIDTATRARTVVIAVAADDAPLRRVRGVLRAHAAASHFAGRGRHVLLIVDSLTRVAHAQREIGLALGEGASARGYPPSALALIPRLVERAGNDRASGGSVTAIYTVLADGDDMNDPVVDAARGVLDGHIVLSRAVAERGIYPAIDIAQSISRSMHGLIDTPHALAAQNFRRDHALVEANRDLVLMGAYAPGSDPALDAAFARVPAMEALRRQDRTEHCSFAAARAELVDA